MFCGEDDDVAGKLVNLLKEVNQQIGSPKDRWNLRDVLKVADELRQPIDAGNAHEAKKTKVLN